MSRPRRVGTGGGRPAPTKVARVTDSRALGEELLGDAVTAPSRVVTQNRDSSARPVAGKPTMPTGRGLIHHSDAGSVHRDALIGTAFP